MVESFSEALEVVHSLADGNRLSSSRSAERDQDFAIISGWQNNAIDYLGDLITNSSDDLDDLAIPAAGAASSVANAPSVDPWEVTAGLVGWSKLSDGKWGKLVQHKVGDSLATAADPHEACSKSGVHPLTLDDAKAWLVRPGNYLLVCLELAEGNVLDAREVKGTELEEERDRQLEAVRIVRDGLSVHKAAFDSVVTVNVAPAFQR